MTMSTGRVATMAVKREMNFLPQSVTTGQRYSSHAHGSTHSLLHMHNIIRPNDTTMKH